jgi:chromosome partitioning protein
MALDRLNKRKEQLEATQSKASAKPRSEAPPRPPAAPKADAPAAPEGEAAGAPQREQMNPCANAHAVVELAREALGTQYKGSTHRLGAPLSSRGRVFVVGNIKGGSGKSTIAMHLAVAIARMGEPVATVDIDAPQHTLSRYVENRVAYAQHQGIALPSPEPYGMPEDGNLEKLMQQLRKRVRFIVVDTPGADSPPTRLAHSFADTVITPLNDSFLDLDVLARINKDSDTLQPGTYAQMFWDAKRDRATRDGGAIEWVVMRNRLSHVDARNKRDMAIFLRLLAGRFGFHLVEGFAERVIYRELFLRGLTLLDLRDAGVDVDLTMSHVAARAELRDLLTALGVVRLGQTDLPLLDDAAAG